MNGFPLLSFCVLALAGGATIRVESIPGQAELGGVEIHGVGAGTFDAAMWRAGTLHFLPDVRAPLITPRLSGVFRNIYAPSAVALPNGWRVFFGAWDGVATPNDRIYSLFTTDLLDVHDRRTEIEHGEFVHVCNVSAIRLDDGSYRMVCTVYPDANGRNKPAFFSSADGDAWNGSPAPYPATRGDIVAIEGYPHFDDADMNGMNVLLYEDQTYRLYFGDFKARGHVHRASGRDGKHFRYEGPCLDSPHMVNDVKKLAQGYLMALHGNTDRLWYALSKDGVRFEPERELAANLGDADRYIVAVGWVAGEQRLLGFLYGAGPVPTLNRNRIHARWLQKKLVFTDQVGRRYEAVGSLGPDRQIISLKGHQELDGRLEVFSEDGKTSLCKPIATKLVSGAVYRIVGIARR